MDVYELISLLLDGQETVRSLQTNNNKITLSEYTRLKTSIYRLFYLTIFPSIQEIINCGQHINKITMEYNRTKENVMLLKSNIEKLENNQSIIEKIIYKIANRDIKNRAILDECEAEMRANKIRLSHAVNLPEQDIEKYSYIVPIEYMIIHHVNVYGDIESALQDLLKLINIIHRKKCYLGSLTFHTKNVSLIRVIMLTIHYLELTLNNRILRLEVNPSVTKSDENHRDVEVGVDIGAGVGT